MNKKRDIKNGEDITLDNGNITILNKLSVAEKEPEVKKEENVVPEVPKETKAIAEEKKEIETPEIPSPIQIDIPVEPPVSAVSPVATIPGIELPKVEETPSDKPDMAPFPSSINDNANSFQSLLATDNNEMQKNEIPSLNSSNYGFGNKLETNTFGNSYDNEPTYDFSKNGYSEPSFNDYNVTMDNEIGSKVQAVSDELSRSMKQLTDLIGELSLQNNFLKEENDKLKSENSDLKANYRVLERQFSNMQSSMKAAQNKLLDVFGMGSMANNVSFGEAGNKPSIGFSQNNSANSGLFTGYDDNNFFSSGKNS